MVFPIDREEEIHSRLISLIQDQIRKVVETVNVGDSVSATFKSIGNRINYWKAH